MNNADKVYRVLMRCRGAYATVRAIADMAGIPEQAAYKALVALDEIDTAAGGTGAMLICW